MHPISSFFGMRLVRNLFILFAGTLIFDEKIHTSKAQPIFYTILGDTKPPYILACISDSYLRLTTAHTQILQHYPPSPPRGGVVIGSIFVFSWGINIG
jgi:hypothetical protein